MFLKKKYLFSRNSASGTRCDQLPQAPVARRTRLSLHRHASYCANPFFIVKLPEINERVKPAQS